MATHALRTLPSDRPRLALLLSLLALGVATLGCRQRDDFEATVERCADLSAAKASPNEQLQLLVAQVEQSRGLPRQLAAPLGFDADNGAIALSQCFTWQIHQKTGDEAAQLLEAYATEGPTEELGEFLDRHESLITKAADAVDLPRLRFAVNPNHGFFADLRCLNDATLATRLLLLRAADSAAGGDAAPAEADLNRALRVAAALSRVNRVETRVLAATLRAESLEIASDLFVQGVFREREAEALYGILRDQLAAWPSDRQMLVGDRAVTLHAYEAIRIGLIDRLLTGRERGDLERRGALSDLRTASPETIDQDEVVYLRAMATLIGAAELPFHERLASFESAVTPSPPRLFAERVFLADTVETQRATARDRARCEAWAIALASAADLKLPPFRVCPTNGDEYEVVRKEQQVEVLTGDSGILEPILPVF